MRKLLVMVATCGLAACGGEAKTAAPTADAQADTATKADGGDAASDATGDAAGDATSDAGAIDAEPAITAFGKYAISLGAKVCLGQENCCGAASACGLMGSIVPAMTEEQDAIGLLTLDPATDATCTAALQGALAACDRDAAIAAARTCLLGWREPAALGSPCHAGPFACADGKGRCVLVAPPDGYKCLAAQSQGDACSTTKPCLAGLECLNGSLTRAMQCAMPGSTCNLSDQCWIGDICDNGSCQSDTGPGNAGAACQDDGACHGGLVCLAGKCAPSMCKPTN